MNLKNKFITFTLALFLTVSLLSAYTVPNSTTTRTDFTSIDNAVRAVKNPGATPEDVAKAITKSAKNDLEKARAIFTWLCDNISYDVTYSIYHAQETFDKRTGVCQGYSELFDRMAKAVDLKSELVSGSSKANGFRIGDNFGSHAWTMVTLSDRKILIDATWGAGSVSSGKFTRSFKDYWFDCDPALFIFTHYPTDPDYQLLFPYLDVESFEQIPYVTPSLTALGFVGDDFLRYFLNNTEAWFPTIYSSVTDAINNGVQVKSLPLVNELEVGKTYEINLVYPTTERFMIFNNSSTTELISGKSTNITFKNEGPTRISRHTSGGSYSGIFGYTASKTPAFQNRKRPSNTIIAYNNMIKTNDIVPTATSIAATTAATVAASTAATTTVKPTSTVASTTAKPTTTTTTTPTTTVASTTTAKPTTTVAKPKFMSGFGGDWYRLASAGVKRIYSFTDSTLIVYSEENGVRKVIQQAVIPAYNESKLRCNFTNGTTALLEFYKKDNLLSIIDGKNKLILEKIETASTDSDEDAEPVILAPFGGEWYRDMPDGTKRIYSFTDTTLAVYSLDAANKRTVLQEAAIPAYNNNRIRCNFTNNTTTLLQYETKDVRLALLDGNTKIILTRYVKPAPVVTAKPVNTSTPTTPTTTIPAIASTPTATTTTTPATASTPTATTTITPVPTTTPVVAATATSATTSPSSKTYAVGDVGPAGGIIFYDKGSFSDGWQYLECAPKSTEKTCQFGLSDTTIGTINGTENKYEKETLDGIGKGKANSTTIAAALNTNKESSRAAQICEDLTFGGYSDWFLPSGQELKLMYTNLHSMNLGEFANSYYWQSYIRNIVNTCCPSVDFSTGKTMLMKKYNNFKVRAIRAF